MSRRVDLTGQRFGRLVAVKLHDIRHQKTRWVFKCDCGNLTICYSNTVKRGESRSCGCLHNEQLRERSTTHGKSRNQNTVYATWSGMRQRCLDPNTHNYPRYGGRGIKVCPRWNDFALFEQDMGPKPTPEHTVHRKDNDGDYCPENCVWATHQEQSDAWKQDLKRKELLNTL